MKKKDKKTTFASVKDRLLDVPSEANRDKHVNFVAQERGETDPALEPKTNRLLRRNSKNKSTKK